MQKHTEGLFSEACDFMVFVGFLVFGTVLILQFFW